MNRPDTGASGITWRLLLLLILFLGWSLDGDALDSSNPAMLPLVTTLIYNQMSNVTSLFKKDVSSYLDFCVRDVNAEWNAAFNFSDNLDFVTNCVKQIKGDVTQRLCTAAEVKLYYSSFFQAKSSAAQFLRPNKNCNLSSWSPGCEPGWCASTAPDVKIDLRETTLIPDRTDDSLPCCEGFFCPRGLTCMMACPLGAYCPRGNLNTSTGICDPYRYQLPPLSNHSCGGADMWADVWTTKEIFCSAGSYCPTTTKEVSCSRGRYCQMGATAQKRCFALSNCKPGTADQDIHVYGIILIVALSLLLLIIYNFSDQVISTRYKRLAKSREAAARSARETAQARQRWKTAKDLAKKKSLQMSRSLSKKPSVKVTEQPKVDQAPPAVPPQPSSTQQPSAKGKKKDSNNLTKMLDSIDDNPESHEGFNLQIGDRNIKKQAPKAKELHSKSQIFKYAYGQLEKEKANEQKKNMTFSGIISMATDETEVLKRPAIEVAFKNLTITLKGKKKHLMRCVSGKIMPGRVSAVMGPSGAGKTTFLSALAGKITGCTMTGCILINGKLESIHSYKRIIGYVPQDDVVHGNLTVEENLRFSARCRLASDLPKADKVLVVERVIESLGLQMIRDSLVGTVEKRGISGGQRKRVNVGLEMVMEPSLLILDEPTSGLDSSSSNLLLKALRREALEGVNICMVLHQPSFVLFQMFDDLILLAKGGFTVYHGSVKQVEEYFSGMGIHVPERVTPPDHFIDILEGITKPGPGLTAQQLPVRWMLHNGYAVPPDMMDICDEISKSSSDKGQNNTASAATGGDTWQDVSLSTDSHPDDGEFNYSKGHDLSGRITPGVLRQYRYFLGRVGKQRLREADMQAADYLILLIAGAALGTLSKTTDTSFGELGYTYTVIALSLLCKLAALRSFALDKIYYWRESSSGISSLAYFLSKDTIDHFNTIVKPLVYLSMYYFFNNTRSSFEDNYFVLVCLVYCVTGMAYVFAIMLEPSPAQLWCVLLPVVLTLIANQDKDSNISKLVGQYCYPKWAMEAFLIANVERYSGVWVITRCGTLLQSGYDLNNWAWCLTCLLLSGVLLRFIAYFCLVTFQKK